MSRRTDMPKKPEDTTRSKEKEPPSLGELAVDATIETGCAPEDAVQIAIERLIDRAQHEEKGRLLQAIKDTCDDYCSSARGSEAEREAAKKHERACNDWLAYLKRNKDERENP